MILIEEPNEAPSTFKLRWEPAFTILVMELISEADTDASGKLDMELHPPNPLLFSNSGAAPPPTPPTPPLTMW